jgi:CMP-N-acetylneuraminic acid synthetase/regulator of RNase E activity RraA
MKIIAVIPVKSTSSRIESKNTKLLCNKPLFVHMLDKLLSIKSIDEVWIDTDDQKIISLAEDYGCENFHYFIREKKYSTNATDGNKLLQNEIDNIDADIYLQILCTSPFIKASSIEKCIVHLTKENHASVVGCAKEKYYLWKNGIPEYDINHIPNSNTLTDTVIESMSIYGITKEEFAKTGKRIGNNPILLELDPEEFIDINYEKDFNFAEKIAQYYKIKEQDSFDILKVKLNSCILSDILNDIGCPNYVLKNFKLNMNTSKLFGRVKPIQIRLLKEGEDSNDIYKCLNSYETVNYGDIIFVNNTIDNKAYFGDLNAIISISKKAQGTIVNGFTRDINRTIELSYPVFYKNNTCDDVKGYGTLDYYNKPITIDGVNIYVNDLIFADVDGIVIIPRKYEDIILEKCKIIIGSESSISNSIILGMDVTDVVKNYGAF